MKKTLGILSLVTGIIAVSCQQQGYKTTPSGVQYRIIDAHNGPKPKEGDFLKLQMRSIVIGDSTRDTVQDTYTKGGPVPIALQKVSGERFDFIEPLYLFSAGDSVELVVPVDSLQPMQRPPFAKKGDKIHVFLKVYAVQTKEQMEADMKQQEAEQNAKEEKAIQDYLTKNHLTANKTEKGVYVVTQDEGNGARPLAGQTVKVDYTGKSLEGKPFDSSTDTSAQTMHHPLQPLSFAVGSGQMIPGFDDGILQLKKGAKATLIIPSSLAWGARGQAPVIEPNEVVVFDVHLLDISGKPVSQNNADTTAKK